MTRPLLLLATVLVTMITSAAGQGLSTSTKHFLDALSADSRSEAMKDLDATDRYKFHFVPLLRQGPSLAELDENQESAAMAILQASLSPTGFAKAQDIIWLENVLRAQESVPSRMPDGSIRRDPEKYHILVFGTPGANAGWAWRFEGHHLSLNFTLIGDRIVSSTPSFFGSNPGKVNENGFEPKEVLKAETALGFELVNSLNKKQRVTAIFSDTAPSEIITGNNKNAEALEPKGLGYSDLDDKQKEIFHKLLDTFIGNYQFGFADLLRDKVEDAGFDQLFFAWAGSLKPGAGHYYRIQGPTLLIEYDNTQNGANHVHTVVRDLTNDFGEDILRDHYASDH